jgi:hypothetical protein
MIFIIILLVGIPILYFPVVAAGSGRSAAGLKFQSVIIDEKLRITKKKSGKSSYCQGSLAGKRLTACNSSVVICCRS